MKMKRMVALLLICAMVVSQIVIPGGTKVAKADTITSVLVVTSLPKYVNKSKLSSMPSSIDVTVNGGSDVTNTPVTWAVKSGDISIIGSPVTLTGTLTDMGNYEITADVLVYSNKLVYFVDCASITKGVTPTVYNDIKGLGVSLNNTVADQSTDGTWGLSTAGIGAKGVESTLASNYRTQIHATGYYGTSNTNDTVGYEFTLDSGDYVITTGHYEWWNGRTVNVSVNNTATDVSIGSTTVSKSGVRTGYVMGEFAMPSNGKATVTFTKGASEAAAVSYIAIEKIEADTSIDISAWTTAKDDAQTYISSNAYTLETENALLDAIANGQAIIDSVESNQDVTDAIALVEAAISGLQMADKSKLVQYVEEPLDTGLFTEDDALTAYQALIKSDTIQAVYKDAAPKRDDIIAAVSSIETARAALTKLYTELLVDGNDIDTDKNGNVVNKFQGFGAVSCNNTSNLLIDYKEEHPDQYWKMMNQLFNTDTGAGISHVKVELGGDVNSSSGTEPATMRSAGETANVLRGAGWHFAADAKSINPNITVEALRWGEPAWTKAGGYEARYKWYKETIDAVYDEYGMKLDYLSPGQNENNAASVSSVADNLAWIKYCAQQLNAETDGRYDYSSIKIVATDSHSGCDAIATAMLNDSELMDLIDVIGDHYNVNGSANLTRLNEEYGKEVWYSEGIAPMINAKERLSEQPEYGGVGGTVSMADLATRYICAYSYAGTAYPTKMTRFEFQPAIAGFYQGSAYSPKQLIGAFYPWSGYYEADGGLQMVQHFTMFSEIGWNYIEGACYGDGTYSDGGVKADTGTNHYMTITDPDTDDYSIIFANNTSQTRSYQIKATNLSKFADKVNVWETRGPDDGEAYDANWMQNIDTITPSVSTDNSGIAYYNITIKPYSIVTVTTLLDKGTNYVSGQDNSTQENTVLALPYTDDFEYSDYALDTKGRTYLERRGDTPRYTSDQRGAFEVTQEADNIKNHVLYQVISQDILPSEWDVWSGGAGATTSVTPNTWLGDQRWANYTASYQFKLDASGTSNNFAGLGVRQNESFGGSDSSGYSARIYVDGSYKLFDNNVEVASVAGIIVDFDASAWHKLSVECKENVITVYLDESQILTYTDTTSPNLCGRISILSGYYNTYYDNLVVAPIDGYAPYSSKIDDSDSEILYSASGWSFAQSGYAHYNRTLKNGSESGAIPFTVSTASQGAIDQIYYYRNDGKTWGSNSANAWADKSTQAYCELAFDGTGFDYYAQAQAANTTANIYVDGTLHGVADLSQGGVVYSVIGLEKGKHTVKVEALNGYTSIMKFKIYDSDNTTSFTYPFAGTGFNLFGATSSATIDVYVDDALVADNYQVSSIGNRDTSYWVRGLENKAHTMRVVVESGTFTLDGIDVIGSLDGKVLNPLVSIMVKTNPDKTEYMVGETLDLSGLTITATYQDSTIVDNIDATQFTVTGYDKNTVGDQILTLAYQGKITTIVVTVKESVVQGGSSAPVAETVKADPTNKDSVSVDTQITMTIEGKQAVVHANVSDQKILAVIHANKSLDKPVQIAIPVAQTSSLINKLKSQSVENAISVITINKEYLKENKKAVISEIDVDKDLIDALVENEKTLTVKVADSSGKVYYAWNIDGEQMSKSENEAAGLNLAVLVAGTDTMDAVDKLVKKDKRNEKGYILALNAEDRIPSGSLLKVNAKEQLGLEAGQAVYVYHYNDATNTVDSMAKVKYKVDEDGFLNMNPKYGDDYVILDHIADASIKRTLMQQIQISDKKLTIKKGKKQTLEITLPEIVAVVAKYNAKANEQYGDEILLAKVKYHTSNSSIATVSKDGTIRAKKAGKVTITTTVLLENSKKKRVKTTITVK
ncbi:MAG: bacterial Ig-like domain-containing protein [Velocimicrobium sp.]